MVSKVSRETAAKEAAKWLATSSGAATTAPSICKTGFAGGENFPAILRACFQTWNIGVLAGRVETYAAHESLRAFLIRRRALALVFRYSARR